MTARSTWSDRLSTVNMVLTGLALLVVLASFAFHLRGGAGDRVVDRVQAWTLWGYLLLTPAIGITVALTRDKDIPRSPLQYWPVILWLCVLIGSTFIHF